MAPFASKGSQPEWRVLYDTLLQTIEHGDLITYEQLDTTLGRSFRENRTPLYRARKYLGAQRQRWLEPVPNQGYRCIPARENITQAIRRREFSKRRMRDAVDINLATDLTHLTPSELAMHDSQHQINTALVAAFQNHEARLQRVERVLRDMGKIRPEPEVISAELERTDTTG
jgi:hypothetical protein